ncbi:hypothetical protein BGZ80_002881 [Entomortierella chlamydospora]|uniref:Uncharacterized protein n=1 Tax=Entomortierella chlamydospora TaxID=101097 RepID=A0A9P6SWU1_9FUNG|nr:hypothetical protein BGZ80_002881 [Entomortierella chlamydospora]
MTGQLEDHELEKIKEVLVIQNRGKKDLPQLPPSSPTQQQQQQQQKQPPQRPLSASSISPPSSKESKEKRRSFNMYSTFNGSMPNHHGKFLTFGSNSSPHNTPTNSRPTTPSPSPLRLFSNPVASSTSPMGSPVKSHSRSHSQSDPTTPRNAQTSKNAHSPLSPLETPLSWPSKDSELKVPQAINVYSDTEPSSGISFARPPISTRSSHASYSKKRPALKRHSSTPNISRPATGLDALEDDPSRLGQLKQLSRFNKNGCRSQDNTIRLHLKDARPYEFEAERQLFDSPLTIASTMPSWLSVAKADTKNIGNDVDTYEQLQSKISMGIERKVDPLDSNGGEFGAMDPVSPKFTKPLEPIGFVPPPHALPMELVLLQTYNDSDHLPEHHEWTQDEDYWYYVTKSHGVRRRKLKKVSTWWLDVGSLGSAFSSGSSSHEPIATRPIYDMGHSTGDSTPVPSGSPLSSEVALPNGGSAAPERGTSGRHTPKQSVSSNHESYSSSMGGTFKRQSSPRNSSHMGKYYYVDWDEYTSL